MRESGRMLATVLEAVTSHVTSGMTTKEIADFAAKELKALGGKPAFLGYQGFPDVICISVNDEVVHGIPRSNRVLQDGDVVGYDFGVNYKGMITDSAITKIIGTPPSQSLNRLVSITEQAMYAGIDAVHAGVHTEDIGYAVEQVLRPGGFGIVQDLVGHGVGHELHEDPNIPNIGTPGKGTVLKTGMTIAIEPMATLGSHRVYVAPDGWTIRTQDGSFAAHFEHTVLITDSGAEILTTL